MSLIGGFRYSSAVSGSNLSPNTGIINFVGFSVSGLTNANALAVCMYKYDSAKKMWLPYTG